MTVRLNPYINFKDTAREAMTFYQSVFGGELTVSTFGDFQASQDPAEQDLVMLAAYGDGRGNPTDPDIWFRILEALCISAGHYRVQRIYAALSQRHAELREVFRQLGFGSYTHQTVMRLEGPDWDQGITLAPMRPQARRDAWAIHKLYGAITPHPVQQSRGGRLDGLRRGTLAQFGGAVDGGDAGQQPYGRRPAEAR